MSRPWFDPATGVLMLDEYVAAMPSFRTVMEDGIVTQAEVTRQAQRTAAALRKLEAILTPEAGEIATEALCELAVLYALDRHQSTPRT